jgi:hypothetical protein
VSLTPPLTPLGARAAFLSGPFASPLATRPARPAPTPNLLGLARGRGAVSPIRRPVATLPIRCLSLVTEISFKIDQRHTVPLEPGEAAQLGLHLAVFGRDEEMPRSRRLAEKIAHAIEIAWQGEPALLQLSDFERDDIRAALDAMVDSRGGDLTLSLEILRDVCAADDPIDAA